MSIVRSWLVLVFCAFAIHSPLASAVEPSSPEEYLRVFQSGLKIEKQNAAASLAWAGISSPKLFDLIEKEVLDNYQSASSRNSVAYVAWMIKALSFSGNEKYRATLGKVVTETKARKLRKYGTYALEQLSLYKKYNPIIAPKAWPEHKHPSLNQRLINMLKSNEYELIRIAAKQINNEYNYQPELLAAVDQAIKAHYKTVNDPLSVDAIAWACRSIAGSRDEQYKAIIEEVSKNALNRKLRKYARKYLKYYR